MWKTQNINKKDIFVGLPPNKRYCLTPLARHKAIASSIVVFGAQTISRVNTHHLKVLISLTRWFTAIFRNKKRLGGLIVGKIWSVLHSGKSGTQVGYNIL